MSLTVRLEYRQQANPAQQEKEKSGSSYARTVQAGTAAFQQADPHAIIENDRHRSIRRNRLVDDDDDVGSMARGWSDGSGGRSQSERNVFATGRGDANGSAGTGGRNLVADGASKRYRSGRGL